MTWTLTPTGARIYSSQETALRHEQIRAFGRPLRFVSHRTPASWCVIVRLEQPRESWPRDRQENQELYVEPVDGDIWLRWELPTVVDQTGWSEYRKAQGRFEGWLTDQLPNGTRYLASGGGLEVRGDVDPDAAASLAAQGISIVAT